MQVVHHQKMPMIDPEPLKCGCECRHVVGRAGRVRARMIQGDIEGNLPGAAATPEGIAAPVHDRPAQPRVELCPVTEPGKVTPRRHERFLDDVVRIGLAPEDRGGSSKGPVEPSRNQRLERVNIAGCGPLDQILIAKGHHPDALRHVHTIRTTVDGVALGSADLFVAD